MTTSSSSTTLPFVKMHHCGNDYVYVNLVSPTDREIYFRHFSASSFRNLFESKAFLDFVVKISHRRFGVGSDGVICLVPPPTAFSIFDVRMKMFNADGSCSKMCGNGLISLAALYSLSSSSSETGSHLIRIATGDESDEKPDLYSISVAKVTLSNDADNDDKKTRRIESVEIKIIDKPILVNKAIPILDSNDIDGKFFNTSKELSKKLSKASGIESHPLNIQMFENQPVKVFLVPISKLREPELFEKLSRFLVSPCLEDGTPTSHGGNLYNALNGTGRTELFVSCVGMGNPHALFVYERKHGLSLDDFPLEELANKVTRATTDDQSEVLIFPEGVNLSVGEIGINITTLRLDGDSDGDDFDGSSLNFTVSQRTFERGSGETLACGSGSCSLVIAAADRIRNVSSASENDRLKITEIDAKVFPKGGETRVRYSEKEGVILSGIPKIVFRGEYEI